MVKVFEVNDAINHGKEENLVKQFASDVQYYSFYLARQVDGET